MSDTAAEPLRILVSAGETSGDLLAAGLVKALRARVPALDVRGMGGEALRSAGAQLEVDLADLSVMGLTEVLGKLPRLIRARRRLEALATAFRPHLVVLVDFQDFHLQLARRLRRAFPPGQCPPILWYGAPKVWAWRRGRLKSLPRAADHLLVLFAFEEALWRQTGLPTTWVGHPVQERLRDLRHLTPLPDTCPPSPVEAKPAGAEPYTLALLPGSRVQEVRRILPAMLQTCQILTREQPLKLVLPRAPGIPTPFLEGLLASSGLQVEIHHQRALEVLARARAALVASGTATLEAACLGVPMVVVYRLSWLTWMIGRLLVRLRWISLVNILAGRQVVPERIQRLDPRELAVLVRPLLEEGPARARMLQSLREVEGQLGEGRASDKAASVALSLLARGRKAD